MYKSWVCAFRLMDVPACPLHSPNRKAAPRGPESGPAIDRISQSKLQRVMVTDTIPLGKEAAECPKVEQLSLAVLLGEGIRRIHEGASVTSLFV